MKWQDKTKEQKQNIILLALLSAAALFIAWQFGLSPFLKGKSAVATELNDLTFKLSEGESIAQHEENIRTELAASQKEMDYANEQYIAPLENPLSWVTEKIYTSARKVGIDIESVAEVGSPLNARDRKDNKQQKIFMPYSVRVVTQCGFNDIIALVDSFEKSNPYLCVSGISVSAQERTVEKHQVSLVVEWPMLAAAPASTGQPAAAPPGKPGP